MPPLEPLIAPEPELPDPDGELLPEPELVPLLVSLSLELRASELELEDWDCIAVASCMVEEVSMTTSSIEPSFWPLRS